MNGATEATARCGAGISYTHEDARQARWLQSALEGCRVPRRSRWGQVPRCWVIGTTAIGLNLHTADRRAVAFAALPPGFPQPLRAVQTAALAL